MNVAVRTIQQSNIFPMIFSLSFSVKRQCVIIFLMIVTLISAFGLIYVKDVNRRLEGQIQTLENSYEDTQTNWSRLLLEKSTWNSQARIERIAHNRLNMVVPKVKSIIMI